MTRRDSRQLSEAHPWRSAARPRSRALLGLLLSLTLTAPALAAPPAGQVRATRGDPLQLLPASKRGLVFGVMGSAAPESTISPELKGRLEVLGRAIARRKGVVLTGACPGMPLVAARAAKAAGGAAVGISPAKSLTEHVSYFHSPTEAMDVIKMTGAGPGMGFIAREKDNIRYSDILVFAGGRSGTLGEMIFAMQEPRVIALLEGSTGVTEAARSQILPIIGRGRAVVVSDRDPDRLIAKAVKASERLNRREQARAAVSDRTTLANPTLADLGAGLDAQPQRPQASAHRRPAPPVSRGPVVTDEQRRTHNVFTFFGSSDGMSGADRARVDALTQLIATKHSSGRAPLLVLPTRPGLAGKVAKAAHRAGATTVGISPAATLDQHRKAGQLEHDLSSLRLTGEGLGVGKLAAYQKAIEKTDVVFVAGGDQETLGGTIFAMYQPTVVAVLETGGMSGQLRSKILSTFDKPAVAKMIYDTDPARLYQRAVAEAAALRETQSKPYINPE